MIIDDDGYDDGDQSANERPHWGVVIIFGVLFVLLFTALWFIGIGVPR